MTNFIFQIYNLREGVLIILLIFFFILQLYFIFKYFFKTISLKPAPESIFENHISVIVPICSNEEKKIELIIEELQSQQFPNFELIMIDNHSMNRTCGLLFELTRKYENVKYTGISRDIRFSEKMNINLGMKASRSEWIIFTSPEVKERNSQWLKKMNNYINEGVDAVVGYSNIKHGKGFIRYLFRMEKMWQFLQGAAFTLGGMTFIADQNNVLIRKKIYFDKGGFRQYINEHYANLELIMNEKLDSKRVRVVTNDGAVISDVSENDDIPFKSLIKKSIQIRKNLSKFSRFCLLLDEYSRMALITSFILMFVYTPLYWEFSLVILFMYLNLLIIILGINQRRLKEKKLFLSSLIYILIRPLLVLFIETGMIIKNRKNRWI